MSVEPLYQCYLSNYSLLHPFTKLWCIPKVAFQRRCGSFSIVVSKQRFQPHIGTLLHFGSLLGTFLAAHLRAQVIFDDLNRFVDITFQHSALAAA